MMHIIPAPKQMIEHEGTFLLPCAVKVYMADCAQRLYPAYCVLQRALADQLGISCQVNTSSAGAQIVLQIDPALEPQSYRLEIRADGIHIEGGDEAAVLYGVQTLRQMLGQCGLRLPCLSIADRPSVAVRGYYYDVARGRVPTLAYLKRLADRCAYYKLNQLQLYVEHSFCFADFSEEQRETTPLMPEEILEFDAYCRGLSIELVPSLASFGHLYTLLRTKQYRKLNENETDPSAPFSFIDRMQHATINVSDDEGFALLAQRIRAYAALFSSDQFNICADETFDLCSEKSRALGEAKGVVNVYAAYLARLCEVVTACGKRPMFWADILLKQPEKAAILPSNSVFLDWDYSAKPSDDSVKALLGAGAKHIYLCPGVQSWNRLICDQQTAYQNISALCRYAHTYKVEGVLTTDWGDFGHIGDPDGSEQGLIYGAAFSWAEDICEKEEIDRRISTVAFGDRSQSVCALFTSLARRESFSWHQMVEYIEKADDRAKQEIITVLCPEDLQQDIAQIDAALAELGGLCATLSPAAAQKVRTMMLMAEGQKLICQLGLMLNAHSSERHANPSWLASEIEEWLRAYEERWLDIAKPSELYRIKGVFHFFCDLLREL